MQNQRMPSQKGLKKKWRHHFPGCHQVFKQACIRKSVLSYANIIHPPLYITQQRNNTCNHAKQRTIWNPGTTLLVVFATTIHSTTVSAQELADCLHNYNSLHYCINLLLPDRPARTGRFNRIQRTSWLSKKHYQQLKILWQAWLAAMSRLNGPAPAGPIPLPMAYRNTGYLT